MLTCDACREQTLDHVYGLLDGAEKRDFLAHVAGCAECAAALEAARSQQALLARAAKLHFPEVTFAPPAEERVTLPMRPSRLRRVAGWAVAAGLLLALAGVAAPAVRSYQEYHSASATVQAHGVAVSDARKKLAEADVALGDAEKEQRGKLEAIERETKARELKLLVTGPRNIQPGAPAEYFIHCVDLNGQPAEADIVARLTDSERPTSGGAPMAAARFQAPASEPELTVTPAGAGTYRVRVPATTRLRAGHSLGMLVSARKRLATVSKPGAMKAEEATREQVRLLGEVRLTAPVYLTHLTTDKPIYQPGEVVRFRSLTLDRQTLAPPAEEFRLSYTLKSPLGNETPLARGVTRSRPEDRPLFGVGSGEVELGPEFPGGEYTLTASEELGRFPPVTRRFLVNRYQKPRLDKKLDFGRASYGPGDEVQARVEAKRADGGFVAHRQADVNVTIDDASYGRDGKRGGPFQVQTDADGSAVVRFTLPRQIDCGAASVAVTFHDGGAVETLSRPIPLVLNKIDVEFFPEGGDLVATVPNRVYLQARTPLGKPAQLRGELLEDGRPLGVAVATMHSETKPGVNQGQGVFAFSPKAGKKYELRVDSPSGIAERKPLPQVREDRVALSVPKGVFAADEPIRVEVRSARPRQLVVGAYCRGQLLETVTLPPGATEAILRPTTGAGGVCRITVFEDTGRAGQRDPVPVAERLVYRLPKERLDVSISPDAHRYVPGQKAKLSIVTTSETERLTPSLALVAVVDQSVLTMADDKTDRAMPTHFLLTTEVRRAEDLEYADFLLSDNPDAGQALDLLLGTQGWRRFAEQNLDSFRAVALRDAKKLSEVERQRRAEDVERLLVMSGQSEPRTTDFDREKADRVVSEYQERSGQALQARADAADALRVAAADSAYLAAAESMRHHERRWERLCEVGVPLLTLLTMMVGMVAVILALANKTARAVACLGVTAACAALLVAMWGMPDRSSRAGVIEKELVLLDNALAMQIDESRTEKAPDPLLLPPPGDAMFGGGVPAGGGSGRGGGMGGFPGVGGAMMPPGGPRMPGGFGGAASGPAPRMGFSGRGSRAAKDFYRLPDGLDRSIPTRQRGAMFMERAEAERKGAVLDRRFRLRANESMRGDIGDRLGQRESAERWKKQIEQLPPEPLVFREYAHVRPAGSTPAMREDFAETLYWHPVLLLPDGKAEVSFDLCDSVTSFRIAVLAHTADGRLGSATRLIESRLPLTLASKVPAEVTAGDVIDVPVAISNNTTLGRSVELSLKKHDGLELLDGKRAESFGIEAESRARRVLRLRPTLVQGVASLGVEAKALPFAADGVTETIRVVPEGFPVTGSSSDLLEKSATHRITLPKWVPGTLEARVDVYPSTLADLQKGLEGLLREPHGCFEQTSTTNYPNVLILSWLKSSGKALPEVEKKSRELLTKGYGRLTSFECKEPGANARRGYEWFGGEAPPHEALTAYGLLQFRDMAKVHQVDRAMIERTRTYLLNQRDGSGGFKRNTRAVGAVGRAPEDVTNAYVIWALTEGGDDDVSAELEALAKRAKTSEDPYYLSLIGLSLMNRSRAAESSELLSRVAKQQKADGQLASAKTSITGSGGRDLAIETTALAVLGWLKADAVGFDKNVRLAVRWLGQQRGGGGAFGSTQSTILALKALIAWTTTHRRDAEAGEVRLFVGEVEVAKIPVRPGVDTPLSLVLPDAEKRLKEGANTLRVEITSERNIFPHTLSWTCRTLTPPSAKEIKVKLDTRLAKSELSEGDPVRLNVRVENVSGQDQGMAVAVVGLPAGLNVPADLKQLKEHCKGDKPLLSAFEIQGRELILYWRGLAKDQKFEVPIDLIARVPGRYKGPASRAYLYYNADHKHWVEPLTATIAAK